MSFRRILCALDFSPGSIAAFRKATEIAKASSARLLIFHAVEAHPVISQWLAPDALGEVALNIERTASESMDSLLSAEAKMLEGVNLETRIAGGRAFEQILKEAGRWKADLVVLGVHGHSGVDHLLFGSTTERVLKGASCSVLAVRGL